MGNPTAQRLARLYVKKKGLPRIRETCPVKVDKEECTRVAEAYDALKNDPKDRKVRTAYNALRHEVQEQYDFAVKNGIRFEFTDQDPYKTSEEMTKDLCETGTLKVFAGCSLHPYLSCTENKRFRAIHDLYGHAARGFKFGPVGEENAWVEHSRMFTAKARAALTTETRGQANWFNCAIRDGKPVNEKGKEPKTFAQQKAALLPREFQSRRLREDRCPIVRQVENMERREAAANAT